MKTSLQKKKMRAYNVARPRQRNIYQVTSTTTCNLHAYRQASELRLNNLFISTTLLSFEQLIHLDYFIWRRVGWWRHGFLVSSWLVARWFLGDELVGGEMTGYRDKGSRQQSTYTYTYDTHLRPLYQKIGKMKIERSGN